MTTLTESDVPSKLFSRPEVLDDIHPTLRRLREMGPLLLSPDGGLVTTYALCEELLHDSRLAKNSVYAPARWPRPDHDMAAKMFEVSMLRQDGPAHVRLRSLVSRAFTARRIADLRVSVGSLVKQRFDQILNAGEMWVDDFATAVPLEIINTMMGIPEEDRDSILQWADVFSTVIDPVLSRKPEERARASQAATEAISYFSELIEARSDSHGDDLISVITNAEKDDRLSRLEVLVSIGSLLAAGYKTVKGAISFGIRALIENPEQWELLKRKPELLGNAVEEILRYETVTLNAYRFTREETTIAGHTLPACTAVTLLYASANRDPAMFEDPDRFDITRANARKHLAFARGEHHCLGAALARMELEAVFGELAARVESLHPQGAMRCRQIAHPRAMLPYTVEVQPRE